MKRWSEWTNGSRSRIPENQEDIQRPGGTTRKDEGREAREAALACDSGVSAAQDGRNLDTNEGVRTHLQRALAVGDHEDLRLIMAVSLPPSQPHTISLLANSS